MGQNSCQPEGLRPKSALTLSAGLTIFAICSAPSFASAPILTRNAHVFHCVTGSRGILTGGDTAATDYFRRTTEGQLTQRFLPIVKKATDRVGLAQQYNSLAGQGASFGLVGKDEATVENYVTRKALDGLYLMIAEQEKKFRQNPVGATSDIVRKVFGALR